MNTKGINVRTLIFEPYSEFDYKKDLTCIKFIRIVQALHWPDNQVGDRKHRENIEKLQDLFEPLVVRFEEATPRGMLEMVRLRGEGGSITIAPDSLWDLLKTCCDKYFAKSGTPAKDANMVERWLDTIHSEKSTEFQPRADD